MRDPEDRRLDQIRSPELEFPKKSACDEPSEQELLRKPRRQEPVVDGSGDRLRRRRRAHERSQHGALEAARPRRGPVGGQAQRHGERGSEEIGARVSTRQPQAGQDLRGGERVSPADGEGIARHRQAQRRHVLDRLIESHHWSIVASPWDYSGNAGPSPWLQRRPRRIPSS